MSEVLSQAEIDALLSALTSGEVSAEEIRDASQTGKVRTYDFRRAMRFSKDHIRIISRIHEHFARLLTTHLSGLLRNIVQIQVESVDQVPYEEFIRSIPPLTVVQVYEFAPLEGKVVLEINPQVVFTMLDRLMGGAVKGPYRDRELTEIELALMNHAMGAITQFFADVWHNVAELEPRYLSMESNPQFLQLTTPNETVLVVTLSAKIGDTTGFLNICIPHLTVEPIIPKLSTQYFMDGGKTRRHDTWEKQQMRSHVEHVNVDVAVHLGSAELMLSDLLGIQVGDFIPLSTTVRDPAVVMINGVPTYTASVGQQNRHYAVKILQELEVVVDEKEVIGE